MHVYKEECKDKRIWRAEKSSMFTVRPAYKLAWSIRRQGMAKAESSRTKEDKGRMWKLVWQLKIKSKLKHFMWRRVHDWLATGEALKEKRMEVDNVASRTFLALK